MDNIEQRIKHVRSSIPSKVTLVAVSKTFDADAVLEAYHAGQRDFGENKVQELVLKANELKELSDIRWHFIGHLQSNKVKGLLEVPNLFMVHSLDRSKIVQRLNRMLDEQEKSLQVLVQVNVSGEESKFGCTPSELKQLAQEVQKCSNLILKGLMTIGKLGGDEIETKYCFSTLHQLFENLQSKFELQYLSMGMTVDYQLAISEGSTMVRIGQAIFGNRALPDSYYWPENK